MDYFWIEVFGEECKDLFCTLAAQIELGRPVGEALNVALAHIETIKNFIYANRGTIEAVPGEVYFPNPGEGVKPCQK